MGELGEESKIGSRDRCVMFLTCRFCFLKPVVYEVTKYRGDSWGRERNKEMEVDR